MGNRMPRAAQRSHQRAKLFKCGLKRSKISQLAANMHRHPAQVYPRQARQLAENLACLADRHAEFVIGLAGRNLVMGARIDIGIDAQRALRRHTLGGRDFGKLYALFLAFDIELPDPGVERGDHLGGGLAHA